MEIRRLLLYAENARRLLRETLDAHPEAWDRPFETLADYTTVHQIAAHLVGAEQRWTKQRLYDEPRPPRYEDQAAQTLEGVFRDWDSIRARTIDFAERADADTLARVITFEMTQWARTATLTAEEALFHLINHQTWHLGQISMALQRMDIDPPNFDYPFLHPHLPNEP